MIVVTGADGQLGTAFRSVIATDAVFLTREDLDLSDVDRIAPTISSLKPTCVINCAAYTDVDAAESDEETANTVNGQAVGELAAVCRERGARFVTFSTDYVFDGTRDGGYVESDTPNPVNVYGRSKLLGETLALDVNPESLIIRTSWLLSGTHRNFVTTILKRLSEGDVTVVADQFGKPTFVNDLAKGAMQAIGSSAAGLLHITNEGVTTWFGIAQAVAEVAGYDPGSVHPCTSTESTSAAIRPSNSVLDSEMCVGHGLAALPLWNDSLVLALAR